MNTELAKQTIKLLTEWMQMMGFGRSFAEHHDVVNKLSQTIGEKCAWCTMRGYEHDN